MLLGLLRRFLAPYRVPIAAVIALQCVATLAMLYLPTLNADLVDNGVTTGDTDHIRRVGMWMLLVTALQIVASACSMYLGSRAAMAAGRDIRAALLRRVGTFSAHEVGRFGVPSLITRTTNDVDQVQTLLVLSVSLLVPAPIMCAGGIVLALRQGPDPAWVLVIAVPVLGAAMAAVIARSVPAYRTVQTALDRVTLVLREQITGIRIVRAFVRESPERERFAAANRELTGAALTVGRLTALMYPLVLVISNVTSVAVLWFGGREVDAGSIRIGVLSAMTVYLMQILAAVMMASFLAMIAPRAAVSAERIRAVFDTRPAVADPDRPRPFAGDPAVVELRGVAYGFPGAEAMVLRDIDFRVEPGRHTAIVGATGSGKTTLLDLIARQIDVTAGSVRVGGTDVRELARAQLRARIAVVPQQSYLFAGTIASNLRLGDPTADDEKLWAALETAQAADFVRDLPGGLAAEVTQGGSGFSGGQRQRLAIARAVVRQPRLYLFDDCFSALDAGTDARVRAALRTVTADASVVTVSQRISTVRDVDRIVVLDRGTVAGIGTHEQLLDSCPEYRELAESQLEAQEVL
ncbi:ABC transporter ATP-binding protein [Nocardia stercoris]|uniref:ABC transporter ATP-binding protein n=1 Tax=Nocardia stercoris TaxID=2483361 RepID=A0A3M2LG00_9NOCA|nr:ABC transporter ATP-binding protein [Nocardia stercoris]RMI33638.1 ABC transporter ATP-binding protein [Nocardia stercoris]